MAEQSIWPGAHVRRRTRDRGHRDRGFLEPHQGIIVALVGLVAFGGFARGRWY